MISPGEGTLEEAEPGVLLGRPGEDPGTHREDAGRDGSLAAANQGMPKNARGHQKLGRSLEEVLP